MPGEGHRSHNEVRGEVYGSVVQAGSVQGGIHIGAPPAAVRQTPWQLPPLVRVVDRSSELAALERHRARAEREGRPALAAVSGLGGVGKTTVALRWLHGLRGRFPAGQLHADLGAQSPDGPEHPGEILARFLRALGIPAQQVPAMLAERTVLYRSLTADRSLVVLLDDAATAAQVRPLLPGGGSVVAVTSRSRLPGLIVDGCYPLHLEPLAPEAAVELLSDTLADGRVGDEPEDARTLVALCAGLPLAVRIAGARLAARPGRRIATMVRSLAAEHQRLEALAIDGDHSVRAALDLSYRTLPPPAARLYRLLGLHPGREFDASVASVLLTTEADAARALDILHEASLLVDAPGERHRFHDLVRLHAAERAREEESPVERAEAVRRIADHYLASATRAEEIIEPQHRTMARDYGSVPVLVADVGAGPDAALDWLERELPNLMAVVHQARSAGLPTVCWQLADALWPLFLRRKFHDDWCAAYREGLAAARDVGDTVAECRMLTSGGLGELDAGHPGRALAMFERAAELFLGRGDLLGHARTLNYRGLALRGLGRPDEAAGCFARAATELPDHGDMRAGALARLNLADLALTTEQAGEAGEAGQTDEAGEARQTEAGQTDEAGEAREAWEARQIVWAEEAIRHAGAARTTLLDVGDTYNAARAATLLGRAQLAANRPGQAAELLSSALATLRGMTANYETARAVEGLAEVSERRGQTDLARTHYQEALDLYGSVGRSGYDEAEAVRSRLRRLERGGPDGS